ncbi:sperm flagellar protein 2-like [Pogoniulus pusillus]|uniref:sperm flagellar protein 2-like n=1 Tax=Pogoniulus pusillus TaxID=488313 RepID=UPI0030B95795
MGKVMLLSFIILKCVDDVSKSTDGRKSVGLWFNDNDPSITKSCTDPLPVDRLKHLLQAFAHTNVVPNKKTPREDEKEILNCTGEGIISMGMLLKVFHAGGSKDEDNHRFSNQEKEVSYYKHFINTYKELGTEDLSPIPAAVLMKHPFIKDLINSYQEYSLPDIKIFLQRSKQT